MTTEQVRERIYSIDFLRGVVMMIMLLDHTRDFVHNGAFMSDPADPSTTTVPVFFTRWITHFCAPAFVFLSGVSIYLQKMAGKSTGELGRFLFTRGLWLIFLEFTLVRFGFTFNLDYTFFGVAQVIWVIGLSMIVMAALVYLPVWIVGSFGVLMIVLHNLLDRFQVPPSTAFGGNPPPDISQILWIILHQQGGIPLVGDSSAFVIYPLIPWVGVMAAGYALGVIHGWDPARRRRLLLGLGIAATVLFVVLRASNLYGDPNPWTTRAESVEGMTSDGSDVGNPNAGDPAERIARIQVEEPAFTLLSFLNTQKYPPSLLFLLMTLGPALIVLALTDQMRGKAIWQRFAINFGRVPMLFYLLQFPLAHAMGVLLSLAAGKDPAYLFMNMPEFFAAAPPDHGFSLPVVYATWIAGLIILYPLCWWWGNLKRRNKHWALSYV